jgi:hypothetical protein
LARSTAFLHAGLRLGVYGRVRVAAKSNSTAVGSSSSATTRMNHRKTTSLATLRRVARYFHGAEIGLDSAALASSGPLDPQFSEGLCLDHEHVGEAVALTCHRLSSSGVELGPTLIVILFSKTIATIRRPPAA